MRHHVWLAALLVVACAPGAPTSTTAKRATPAPTAKAAATTAPTGGALKRPATGVVELAGSVLMEASYAVTVGGGKILSNNGSSILQLGNASLIANNGGNIISDNGGAIISDNGGGIISDNGGGIISDNGGGIISDNGGGLTSKVKRGLLADAAPTIGTVVPAAGLTLGVVDLLTGKLLTLGQDAGGRPAQAIITNSEGKYRIFVPASAKTTVRVVAVGSADPRLQTTLVTSHPGTADELNEDTAQVANDVRSIMGTNFFRLATRGAAEEAKDAQLMALLDPQERVDVDNGLKQIVARYEALHVKDMPDAKRLRIAYRLADVVLAHMDLESIPSTSGKQPAVQGLRDVLRALRVHIGEVMARQAAQGGDPSAYFAAKPYITKAEARDHVSYTIKKPADFDDFLIRGILGNPALSGLDAPLEAAKVFNDPDVRVKDENTLNTMIECQLSVGIELFRHAYSTENPALPDMLIALEVAAQP
ncbi:MAG: hypothetical protein JWM80_2739 [Cyanobacteria bacterium RYN_339]|nr:hypothetical protein [Cyanobacteria bacterium RYN_339]